MFPTHSSEHSLSPSNRPTRVEHLFQWMSQHYHAIYSPWFTLESICVCVLHTLWILVNVFLNVSTKLTALSILYLLLFHPLLLSHRMD